MKILITGFNKNQCTRQFYLGQQLKVVPSHYSLYNCLIAMGHTVEQREVVIGEDLSSYDDVIVFIAAPRQLVTTKLYNGLYAISQRPDCILAVDDFQADDLYKGVEKCLTTDDLTCDFVLNVNKKTQGEVFPFVPLFKKALETIAAKRNRMLVSAFSVDHLDSSYGAHTIFSKVKYPKERVFSYNPNPYHRNRHPFDYTHDGVENPHYNGSTIHEKYKPQKEKRLNFASLVQSKTKKWLKDQGYDSEAEEGKILDWKIDLYGSKAESQKRLTEDEMCKVIARDWGTMLAEYNHSKSAWWRARPLQAAMCGSILIGGKTELAVYYGADYPFFALNAKNIQQFPEHQLEKILFEQQTRITRLHPLDKNKQQAELQEVLMAQR